MFRNNCNAAAPFLDNNHFQSPADASNQLKLFMPSNQKASFLDQNHVSTGLRLSYDEDEQNSIFTSACGSMAADSSVFSSLNVDVRRELNQHKEELELYVRTQEENLLKGLKDIRQNQFNSLLTALENSVLQKLHEKNLELLTIIRKNKELVERTKHLTAEAQNWFNMAKYNESVINVLKTSLQQALRQVSNQGKAQGETDIDDAASCIDPNNFLSLSGEHGRSIKNPMICRFCKSKKASVLLMPCRHLCLCKNCEVFASACPVCEMMTTASFEVYLS